jgi:hypothetical protein
MHVVYLTLQVEHLNQQRLTESGLSGLLADNGQKMVDICTSFCMTCVPSVAAVVNRSTAAYSRQASHVNSLLCACLLPQLLQSMLSCSKQEGRSS